MGLSNRFKQLLFWGVNILIALWWFRWSN